MNKLAKCGCGGEAQVHIVYGFVYCKSCGIRTSTADEEEAIEVWNRAMGKRNKRIEA